MNLWNFNLFFCIACILMFYINIKRAESLMKYRYPELHFRRTSFLTGLATFIKILVVSICPFLNMALLYTLIFKDNEMIEAAVKESYDNYHKSNHAEVDE